MSEAPDIETVETLIEMGGENRSLFNMCFQCGTCTGTCPWNLVKRFGVRRIMHEAQLGLTEFDDERIWTCATCGACVARCPRGVEIIDVMRAIRMVVAEMGVAKVPDSLRLSVKNIQGVGNPQKITQVPAFGLSPATRMQQRQRTRAINADAPQDLQPQLSVSMGGTNIALLQVQVRDRHRHITLGSKALAVKACHVLG